MNLDQHNHSTEMQKHQTEQVTKQQREYKLIGHTKRIPGLTMFSFNFETGEIKKAEIEAKAYILLSGSRKLKSEIKIEPNCVYRQALNKKNFIKVLRREGIIHVK